MQNEKIQVENNLEPQAYQSPGLPSTGSRFHEKKEGARADDPSVQVTSVDEDAAIDGVDPIYTAKAKVLNRAVR